MSGLSLSRLRFELAEIQKDLKAWREAGLTIERRLLASQELSRHNNIATSALGVSAQSTLMLGTSFLERLASDYTELIRQVESGQVSNTDEEKLQ